MSIILNGPPHTEEDALPPAHRSDSGFDYRRVIHEGDGPHETLAARVDRELHRGFDPLFGERALAEVLLPSGTPGEYLALAHVLDRHDRTHPPFESRAWVELTIAVADGAPMHQGWERVRAFARNHFCTEQELAVLMILRSPYVDMGSASVLLIVPARRLGINGFTGVVAGLFSDTEPERCRDCWRCSG